MCCFPKKEFQDSLEETLANAAITGFLDFPQYEVYLRFSVTHRDPNFELKHSKKILWNPNPATSSKPELISTLGVAKNQPGRGYKIAIGSEEEENRIQVLLHKVFALNFTF